MATPKETLEANAAKIQKLLAKQPDLTIQQLLERFSLSRDQLRRICKRYSITVQKQFTRGWVDHG
jgi:hypothetical protein